MQYLASGHARGNCSAGGISARWHQQHVVVDPSEILVVHMTGSLVFLHCFPTRVMVTGENSMRMRPPRLAS